MKTSNKLFIAVVILVLVSITIYDFQLRAAYNTGQFRKPYSGYVNLQLQDFKVINLRSASIINIKLVKGPFKVLASPKAMDLIKTTRHGDTLTIYAHFKYNFYYTGHEDVMYISCPELSAFIADAQYTIGSKQLTDTVAKDFSRRVTEISGFSSPSLRIIQDHGSKLLLSNDTIAVVDAVAGLSSGSASSIVLGENNRLGTARLDIRHGSRLWIRAGGIDQLDYHIADSAQLIVSGAAQHILKTTQP
ncbi:hypothetical protein F0L74_21890 [Chitinophaga agrisoli]|uniref:Uncharacterized protein n=1 Tax=Chitinophaga agrisoli TaxID=2607653 RepID=A0A5B2VL11_9BACT|nr:hypothetical protein [Chitinophaga agrisoli]KAA2238869.1 hypothetical protein F0L74_21890 [Chitinophaga agrisoli]